jgi:hypothetical protein
MMSGDANVAKLSDWKADRERRARQILKDGLTAAVDALFEWTGRDQDVRIALVAMYGDPYSVESDQSTPIEAQFICLDGASPLTDAQRRYLALETTRAASEGLFREMKLGLAISDLVEDLGTAAEDGDEGAEAALKVITDALARRATQDDDDLSQAPAAADVEPRRASSPEHRRDDPG